ncbi:MAG: AAA family ATPase [Deltaproteobacteria bacterium]|nr:AAA family ATPase [Deltaproteobacteria bacterium]
MHVVDKGEGLISSAEELGINPREGIERKRVSTGITQLDLLIGGGFLKGKTYLITGDSGTGKTIFATAFILKDLMEGEKAVYVSVDDKPSDIVEQAASLGWDLMKYIADKQLLMLDAAPFFTGHGGMKKELDIPKTVADLASYVNRLGASRVVVDPVGPLVPSREGRHIRDNARTLIRSLRDHLETTNLLVLPSAGTGDVEEWEEYPVAGVIILKLTETQRGLMRTVLVRKMRATAVELTEHPFKIIGGKGIVIEPSMPVAAPPAPVESIPIPTPTHVEAAPVQAVQPRPIPPEEEGNIFEAWNPIEEKGKKVTKKGA